MSLADTSALYAEVKAWISQQEAFEQTAKQPAPVTNAQRKALEVLRIPISVTPPPELGDVDYVSLLARYRQANPTGEDIAWAEDDAPVKLMGGTVGRTCRVGISESRGHAAAPVDSFPAVGYGLEKGGDPPAFPKKKEAKQYAAKCAIDWLIAQSFMPPNLRDVTFPKGHQPNRFVPPSSSSSTIPSTTTTTAPAPSPLAPKRAPGPVDFRDETLSATERVSALCPELGLQPPTYRLERSISGVERYYDGYPDFGHENASMPEGLGRVRKVEGREGARARIAELALEYLLAQYRERQGLFEELSVPDEGAAV